MPEFAIMATSDRPPAHKSSAPFGMQRKMGASPARKPVVRETMVWRPSASGRSRSTPLGAYKGQVPPGHRSGVPALRSRSNDAGRWRCPRMRPGARSAHRRFSVCIPLGAWCGRRFLLGQPRLAASLRYAWLLHCIAPLGVPPAACPGLSGRSCRLPPTPGGFAIGFLVVTGG